MAKRQDEIEVIECGDFSLLEPSHLGHMHVRTPVFSSYSCGFIMFDEQKECSFHWRVGSNVNRNVAFAFAFHRMGLGLNYSITVEKKK
jgi:hypothetical protein